MQTELTTHRIIQVSAVLDAVKAKAFRYRVNAIKATELSNRGAAIYFVNRAQKCDRIAMRCYLVLGRDFAARAA